MLLIISIIVLAVIISIWFIGIYNSLIQKRNKTLEGFSAIDVQLKKRYDLIPNILTIAQKYMDYEKGIMEEITKLRTQVMQMASSFENIDKKIALDEEISKKMSQLIVSVENYPQLKADQTMITAMQTYNEVEEHVAAARRFYNSAVLDLKNSVDMFPSSIVANMFDIKAPEFFKSEENEQKSINASDYLK